MLEIHLEMIHPSLRELAAEAVTFCNIPIDNPFRYSDYREKELRSIWKCLIESVESINSDELNSEDLKLLKFAREDLQWMELYL